MSLLEAKLRAGTEILRTGGGANLTARECGALLDVTEAAKQIVEALTGKPWAMVPSQADELAAALARLEEVA